MSAALDEDLPGTKAVFRRQLVAEPVHGVPIRTPCAWRELQQVNRRVMQEAPSITTNSDELVQFLRDPSFYPDCPTRVEVVETHISGVFLTDRYAYKLKKPVKFEFLDFSTIALRYDACLEELRLNRRLSPDVYRDVLPITQRSDGTLQLDGGGRVCDWVVKMRRLPSERALAMLLRERRLKSWDAAMIASSIAAFYAGLPSIAMSPSEHRRRIEKHILANGEALLSALPAQERVIRRLQGLQRRYLCIDSDAFDRRVTHGRLVDGHGDLRPEHIFAESPLAIIDCIEFSQELRINDVADELAFFAMECERLKGGFLGDITLKAYQRLAGDDIPGRILAFYTAYRATVRAKVTLLRDQQYPGAVASGSLIREYIQIGERHASTLGAPSLLLVGGLMGTGKSTLAAAVAHAFGAELLSTDRLRRSLLGLSDVPADFNEGNYTPTLRRWIYEEMLRRASQLLNDGLSVILDGTFLVRALREQAHQHARQAHASSLFVLCTCSRELALSRIEKRAKQNRSDSEARPELYDRQAHGFEEPQSDEPAIAIDTSRDSSEQLATVGRRVHALLFND